MEFDGHREWLEDLVAAHPNRSTTKYVIARAALYLGECLTAIAWASAALGAQRRPPSWWLDKHGYPSPEMEDG